MCLYEEKMLLQKVLQVSNVSKVADSVAFRQLKRKLLVRQVNKYVKYFKMLTIISKKNLVTSRKEISIVLPLLLGPPLSEQRPHAHLQS